MKKVLTLIVVATFSIGCKGHISIGEVDSTQISHVDTISIPVF